MNRITLDNGKYTIIEHEGGRLEALRYNEPWRDLCGDNLIHALFERILELEQRPKPSPHWQLTPVIRQDDGPQEHEG